MTPTQHPNGILEQQRSISGNTGEISIKSIVYLFVWFQCSCLDFEKCIMIMYDVSSSGSWVEGTQNSGLSLHLFYKSETISNSKALVLLRKELIVLLFIPPSPNLSPLTCPLMLLCVTKSIPWGYFPLLNTPGILLSHGFCSCCLPTPAFLLVPPHQP